MLDDATRIDKAGRNKIISEIVQLSDRILKRVSPSGRGVTNKKGYRSYLERSLSTEDLLEAWKEIKEELHV